MILFLKSTTDDGDNNMPLHDKLVPDLQGPGEGGGGRPGPGEGGVGFGEAAGRTG